MILRITGFLFFISIFACGCASPDDHGAQVKKRKADSLKLAGDEARNREIKKNIELSKKDSVQAVEEYNRQLERYDSMREADSLKVKRKKHPAVKPAPKRDLNSRSPVK